MPSAIVQLPDNSVVKIIHWGVLNGQQIMNDFYVRLSGGAPVDVDYLEVMDALASVWMDIGGSVGRSFIAMFPQNYTLTHLTLQPIFPDRLRYFTKLQALEGGIAADASTSNLALSIRRVSQNTTRHGVGRLQIPIADGKYDGGNVDLLTYGTLADDFIDQLVEPVNTVLPSLTFYNTLYYVGSAGVTNLEIQDGSLEPTVRTMRRRGVRLGV